MKTYLDCYPCFLRQALEAARAAGASGIVQYEVVHKVLEEFIKFDPQQSPPEMAAKIHAIVRLETKSRDPYFKTKKKDTELSLKLYPKLKNLVAKASDPFEVAVRLAIAGNIIDVGVPGDYDIEATVKRVLNQPFSINDQATLKRALEGVSSLLYLADNAGETVFDRILIEEIGKTTRFLVKAGPVLNDATKEDAIAVGLDTVTNIIDNGSDAPGTVLPLCSAAFVHEFQEAPLIIAKGQANYECLSDCENNIFFLLQAKCPVIAHDLGVPVGSIVLKQGGIEAKIKSPKH
jgi:uncharacterized protein with ATP-grasp and redox domains